MAGFRHR